MLNASYDFIQTMSSRRAKEVFVKIEIYDRNMNFINEITKFVTADDLTNISIDRTRAIRRGFSFALDNMSTDNLFVWGEDNLIWLDKRVRLYIGLKLLSGEIEWVLQGTYVISDFYNTASLQGKKTYITGQDKSYLLGDKLGLIDGIFKELVGEDLYVYPTGESPAEILTILQANSSVQFINRLLNPQNFPNPTITVLDSLLGDQTLSPVADPELVEYFSNQFLTHSLELKPSPSDTPGDDPYRVFSKIYVENGNYEIIHDIDAAYTSAVNRGDFLDFPTYYEATIFMIHCYQKSYFDYYASIPLGIYAPSSHLRPTTTAKVSDIIKALLQRAGETEALLIDDLPQYQGDPDAIEVGTDILTRDLDYTEGTSYISIIEELASLIQCEFFYDVFGHPRLKRINLNDFTEEPTVWQYNKKEINNHLYLGGERKMNISNLANRIHVYGGGAKDRMIIYRLVVSDSDPLFLNSPFAVEKIGNIIYPHNNGEPDPNISTGEEAIYRAVFELKQKLGYSEEVPIEIIPNYLLEAGDIIEIIDEDLGVSNRYMIDKLDIPIQPSPMKLDCRREHRVIGDGEDDWNALKDELIRRYKEE